MAQIRILKQRLEIENCKPPPRNLGGKLITDFPEQSRPKIPKEGVDLRSTQKVYRRGKWRRSCLSWIAAKTRPGRRGRSYLGERGEGFGGMAVLGLLFFRSSFG